MNNRTIDQEIAYYTEWATKTYNEEALILIEAAKELLKKGDDVLGLETLADVRHLFFSL